MPDCENERTEYSQAVYNYELQEPITSDAVDSLIFKANQVMMTAMALAECESNIPQAMEVAGLCEQRKAKAIEDMRIAADKLKHAQEMMQLCMERLKNRVSGKE